MKDPKLAYAASFARMSVSPAVNVAGVGGVETPEASPEQLSAPTNG